MFPKLVIIKILVEGKEKALLVFTASLLLPRRGIEYPVSAPVERYLSVWNELRATLEFQF